MAARLRQALARAEEVAAALADPRIASDPTRLKALGREHYRLMPVVRVAERLSRLRDDLRQARELQDEADPELAAMVRADLARLPGEIALLEAELYELLLPRDPLDDRDAIIEIRAGTGGDEAALFAADLFRMYQRFVQRRGLTVVIISLSDGAAGGIKEAIFAVRGPDAFGLLRREAGVHRVQPRDRPPPRGRGAALRDRGWR